MADLYQRLYEDRDRIPVHLFASVLREVARGQITKADVAAELNLSGQAATDANVLFDYITAPADTAGKILRALEMDDVLLLGEQKHPGYETRTNFNARAGL